MVQYRHGLGKAIYEAKIEQSNTAHERREMAIAAMADGEKKDQLWAELTSERESFEAAEMEKRERKEAILGRLEAFESK